MWSLRSLGKKYRLQTRREFSSVLNNGVFRANETTVVRAQRSDNQYHRLGVVVSKRVGSAVVRNRIKRQLRETFRTSTIRNRRQVGIDFVIIARTAAANHPAKTLVADCQYNLVKLDRQLRGKEALAT